MRGRVRVAAWLVLGVVLGGGGARGLGQGVDRLPELSTVWQWADPAASERAFRALLPRALEAGDATYMAAAMTQVARAQGLQGAFEAGHLTLDRVESLRSPVGHVVKVRVGLERGRLHNSSGQPAASRPLFARALTLAQALGEDALAVDAAHMLGIVGEGPREQTRWNRLALALARSSTDPAARRWRGSLLNNQGWTHHDAGEFEAALAHFEEAVEVRREQGKAGPLRIARWCVSRARRSLGRLEEALGEQLALAAELEAAGEQDGYVQEELGELLLALGHPDRARPHFRAAHELLSEGQGLAPERLARLEELGQ